MKTVKIFNTGEIRENKFYFLETPGKIETQNAMYQPDKIEALSIVNLTTKSPLLPSFIKRVIPHSTIESEMELEKVRQENFSDYPSRCASFFAFDNIEDVLKYKLQEPTGREIFEMEIISSNYKITKHNMEYVSIIRSCHEAPEIVLAENLFHKYWSGEASNFDYGKYNLDFGIISPCYEYLIEGKFKYKLINLD